MNQVRIICKINEDDSFKVDEKYIEYNINHNNRFTYTFWNKQLDLLPNFFTKTALDIFYISLFVFGADRIISRNSTDDSWTRNIKLYIPVLDKKAWLENKSLLEEMLSFLSGDSWEIEFRRRELNEREIKFKDSIEDKNNIGIDFKKVCMFSGGLDSFIGAIELLDDTSENDTLFVSHYGGGKGIKEYQDILREELISKYQLTESNFYSFYASAKNGVEDTTRTRSFMFFSHAVVLASSVDRPVNLVIPENGLISLNIPLTNSRLGSSSTRTTHPFYLSLFQKLLDNLKIMVKILNPYQFKTKGEMIRECSSIEFLQKNITNTMSCSHPDWGRWAGESEVCHCGYCLPCVIRRSAIKNAGIQDETIYRDFDFTSLDVAKMNYSSYMLGVRKFDSKLAFLDIQKAGPLNQDLDRFTDLYIRGMSELIALLED
ncbi:conserved hypothetical protein [Shouchella clausii KSM-K16]|uniref:ATPase n=1 Tax=Shouchella clausii (strain KSM-K16) TaxID=66692 RepID=Q5WAJ2_SHOC1|nr:Qat anti-phage system QueC-like protein QatC [Shouchella clausii]BAD66618.1 conserved hypothetical protein [Shouchella clausii KSM-K16]